MTSQISNASPADRSEPPVLVGVNARSRRMRSPLLVTLWTLLAFEAVGGLTIFVARLAVGSTPGETLHVIVGLLLMFVYAVYQWQHWFRVEPIRKRLDYGIGLLAAAAMIFVNVTGVMLGLSWWRDRVAVPAAGAVSYTPIVSAAHNIACMLVLTFAGAHLGAVLFRDQKLRASRAARRGRPGTPP